VHCLIAAFKAGVVPIPEGTTLRVFLSSMLNCPAKRISKKFVGTNYNGKQLYVRRSEDDVEPKVVAEHHKKLREMEQRFAESLSPMIDFRQLAQRQQQNVKAAETAAVTSTTHSRTPSSTSATMAQQSLGPSGSLYGSGFAATGRMQSLAPPQGQLPLEKLNASHLLDRNMTSTSAASALMKADLNRLMEMQALRRELEMRLTAQNALEQTHLNAFQGNNTMRSATNTMPSSSSSVNDRLLDMLRQRVSLPLITTTPSAMFAPPSAAANTSESLLCQLKRKFEAKDVMAAPTSAAKRARIN